jgi:hypothetical protein
VAVAAQRLQQVQADELGAAGDEDAHPQPIAMATQVVVRVTPSITPIWSVTS